MPGRYEWPSEIMTSVGEGLTEGTSNAIPSRAPSRPGPSCSSRPRGSLVSSTTVEPSSPDARGVAGDGEPRPITTPAAPGPPLPQPSVADAGSPCLHTAAGGRVSWWGEEALRGGGSSGSVPDVVEPKENPLGFYVDGSRPRSPDRRHRAAVSASTASWGGSGPATATGRLRPPQAGGKQVLGLLRRWGCVATAWRHGVTRGSGWRRDGDVMDAAAAAQ